MTYFIYIYLYFKEVRSTISQLKIIFSTFYPYFIFLNTPLDVSTMNSSENFVHKILSGENKEHPEGNGGLSR